MNFNRLTRRRFLRGLSAVGLAQLIGVVGLAELAVAAPTAFGRQQLGLNGVAYFNQTVMPFINLWKVGGDLQVINNGQNYFSFVSPPGYPNSPWGLFLDPNGELINPLPANTTHFVRIVYAQPIDGIPPGFNLTGSSWVLKWDGDPALTVTLPLNGIVRAGARLTGTWTDNTGNKAITFSNFSLTNPPTNIRFCRAEWEPLLDAGDVFSPDYANEARTESGVVRFMNWASTNDNRSTTSYANIPTELCTSWGEGTQDPHIIKGVPLTSMWKFANKVRSYPWFCIPGPFGVDKFATITDVTQANPPVVSAPGHTFVNGDQAIPYRVGGMVKAATVTMTIASPCVVTWPGNDFVVGQNIYITGGTLPTGIISQQSLYVLGTGDSFQVSKTPGGPAVNTTGTQSGVHTGTAQLNRNKFTVQNVVAGVSFELAGTNATTYSAYSGSGWFMSPLSFSRLASDMTSYATEVRNNLIQALIAIFEYSNEFWNAGVFDCFHYLAAQAHCFLDVNNDPVFPGDDGLRMGGYISAACMRTVRDVYGVANRARWRGILPSQTVNTGVTSSVVAGANRYIADVVPTLTLPDLFDDGAITNYFGGGNIVANASQGTPGLSLSVTIDVSTDVFTATNHGYQDKNPLKFTGTMPSPLVVGTLYYARDVTTSTFKVALTPGGAVIDLSGSVGSNTVICAMADWSLAAINTSIARFNSNLELTRYSYFIRTMGEDDLDGRWTGQPFCLNKIEAFIATQKTAFNAVGLGHTAYEGGYGGDITAFISSPDFALYVEFVPQYAYSADNAFVQRTGADNFVANGGRNPSQYVDNAPPTRFGYFGARPYTGSPSNRADAARDFNAKSLGWRP